MEKGILNKLVSKFGYQKAKGYEDKVKETQLRPTAQSGKYVKQTKEVPKGKECSKSFRRPCELRQADPIPVLLLSNMYSENT